MKKLIVVLITSLLLISSSWALTPNKLSTVDKIKDYPGSVEIIPGWFRVVIKENISETAYDWRFDLRKIETADGHIVIGHRMEQISGTHPTSSWVIEYTYVDYDADGVLDNWLVDRFISIKDGEGWFKTTPYWPDKFNYPIDNIDYDEANKLFQKELKYWKNKLNMEE